MTDTPTPTAGAMRVSKSLYEGLCRGMGVKPQYPLTAAIKATMLAEAALIDRETKLPELLAALRDIAVSAAGYSEPSVDQLMQRLDRIADTAVAAIAAAEEGSSHD